MGVEVPPEDQADVSATCPSSPLPTSREMVWTPSGVLRTGAAFRTVSPRSPPFLYTVSCFLLHFLSKPSDRSRAGNLLLLAFSLLLAILPVGVFQR